MTLSTIADITLALVAVFGMIGAGLNIFILLRNRADIAEMKLWAMDRFVSKTELSASVSSYQREAQQLRDSWTRIKQARPDGE